jgi:transposase
LEPALEEAKEGKAVVYFIDSAHFVMGAFLSILWSFSRIFIKTSSGRQRFNVLGALNAVSLELITVVNESYINAWSVVDLFQKIRTQHPLGKIVLILDNAKYQKCHVVQCAANMLNIQLIYLPPYSPNLNLIERVWKFIRKKSLNCRYYESFDLFKSAIQECISKFGGDYQEELKTLLTWSFQTFATQDVEEKAA